MQDQLNLYRYSSEKHVISLNEAVTEWKDELAAAVALLYTPKSCEFVSLEKIEVNPPPFEARIFNEKYELRWVADAQSYDVSNTVATGRAVVLTEEAPVKDRWNAQPLEISAKLDQKYLLWGDRLIEQDDRKHLFEHRIGVMELPIQISEGQRATLKTAEYFGLDDEYGNMALKVERLVKLTSIADPNAPKGKVA